MEIGRIRKSMKNPRFCSRVLGKSEYAQLARRGFPVPSVAASFAAKEAFAKALGIGFRGFSLREVQLLRGDLGEPLLTLEGAALKLANKKNLEFCVSITHTKEYAAAVVVAQQRA